MLLVCVLFSDSIRLVTRDSVGSETAALGIYLFSSYFVCSCVCTQFTCVHSGGGLRERFVRFAFVSTNDKLNKTEFRIVKLRCCYLVFFF